MHALKISNRGKKVSSICNGEKNVIVEFQLFNISKNVFTSEGLSFDADRRDCSEQLTPFCFVFENTENSAGPAKLRNQDK